MHAKKFTSALILNWLFLVRDVIYTYHAYATMSVSVCPSVCDGSALGRGACRVQGRDHRREEWRDHLTLC